MECFKGWIDGKVNSLYSSAKKYLPRYLGNG